jgi:hypothetical protein
MQLTFSYDVRLLAEAAETFYLYRDLESATVGVRRKVILGATAAVE